MLGIETSCDECAAAVVAGRPGAARILADVVLSQIDLHQIYGGVVPEIAARAHAETIDGVVAEALRQAGLAPAALDAVAATAGPGLLGGLLVGATFGKALADGAGVPFVAVPAGAASYGYTDATVDSAGVYEFAVAAQDCTPTLSSLTSSGWVAIP
mgnify:CR=1 FL=1